MITCGLTGGIGSGKSLIAKIFKQFDVPVFDSDGVARYISDQPSVVQELQSIFGPGIVTEGRLNRKQLATLLFSQPESLQKVNDLIHPKVRVAFKAWCSNHNEHAVVIQESAILFETGFFRQLDRSILVVASGETRIKRVMMRDQKNESEVRARMENQWADARKIPLADFIIDNNGEIPVLPQVMAIHEKLKEIANGKIR